MHHLLSKLDKGKTTQSWLFLVALIKLYEKWLRVKNMEKASLEYGYQDTRRPIANTFLGHNLLRGYLLKCTQVLHWSACNLPSKIIRFWILTLNSSKIIDSKIFIIAVEGDEN